MTSRILFVAYHYPPENAIGAARPARFTKYLTRQGFHCHVITASEPAAHPDEGVAYIPDPFSHERRKGIGFQFERALRKFVLPGAIGTHWSDLAYSAGLRYIEQHADDPITIFSTFPPVGVHMAGYRLAAKTSRPWIADFRDPMAHNPIIGPLGAHTRAAYRWMEKRVVRRASAIIANTDGSEAILKRTYPEAAAKIHLLWNGFDPEQRTVPLPLPARPFRLYTHTGELYQGRTIAPLLQSFGRLFTNGRISPDTLRVSLIGPVEPECMPDPAFLSAAQSAGWLSITPRQIPKADAQLAAQTSDGLLIVQPQSAVQVPGKVYDYLQIGRPVLALLPPGSAVERILSKAGIPYRCLYTSMPADALDNTLLDFLSLPSDPVSASSWFEDTFSSIQQTAFLASVISGIQGK